MPASKIVTMRLKGANSIRKAAPQKTRQKALVTAVAKGFWTPNKVTSTTMNRLQAKVQRQLQLQQEKAWEMEAAESVMMLMTGDKLPMGAMHPDAHEVKELELEIKYIHAIIDVMLKIPRTRSFDNAIRFLHYLRGEAWKRGVLQTNKAPTIFDIVDLNGEIVSYPTAGEAAFYEPPLELLEAAKFFLRVRRYKANVDLKSTRIVKLDKDTSIINLDAGDRINAVLDVPDQRIAVAGSASDLPKWALMTREGEDLGLYRRSAEPNGFVIHPDKTAHETCVYEAY